MSNQSKRAKNAIKKAQKSRLANKTKESLPLLPAEKCLNDKNIQIGSPEEFLDIMQRVDELRAVPKVDIDYNSLISNFSGSMEEWDQLVLKTHINFGLSFEYEDLAKELIQRIILEFPNAEYQIKNNNLSIAELVIKLRKSHTSIFIEMLAITDEQDDAFWRGDLDEYLP
ncbi:hypothetical protein RS130_19590 [Paraglaciecola aquimarina]|uniref:Orphan protein n=1 Tax=Paraglaciecola aquimarina TaxID=1235557 RepID=A0ABU3T0L0_9ALTE|nr:hypothetical protein [Paraglaciecola aquimarina]MDU0355794.1 hypothetical protein [Paraglaciecola aquimarina]